MNKNRKFQFWVTNAKDGIIVRERTKANQKWYEEKVFISLKELKKIAEEINL